MAPSWFSLRSSKSIWTLRSLRRAALSFLVNFCHGTHFVLLFKNYCFEGRETCPCYDCALSLGKGGSWVLLWSWRLFWIYLCLFLCHHLRVHLYTCMSYFSPKRCQQINKKEISRLLIIYLFMPYPLPITYSSTLNWWRWDCLLESLVKQ